MTTVGAQTRRVIDQIFDCGLLRHGFTDYMRDYELLIDNRGPEPATPDYPDGYRVVFRNCVYARAKSSVFPPVWRRSLGDHLLGGDIDQLDMASEFQGYVWGVRVQFLDDLGAQLIEDSPRATEWSEALGLDFCEVELNGNAHIIRLVYSGISIEPWDPATLRRSTDSSAP
jgi:hypothetical protein